MSNFIWTFGIILILSFCCFSCSTEHSKRITIFSKTAGFRHDNIEYATKRLESEAKLRRIDILSTESSEKLMTYLPNTDLVIFLNTTGDILNKEEQTKFKSYIRAGGNFLGIHSAADTEHDWKFYQLIIGTSFKDHPAIQTAKVESELSHPCCTALPEEWEVEEEWYNFKHNLPKYCKVLQYVDETSYAGGKMGANHPIAWYNDKWGGKCVYIGMGHRKDTFDDPLFIQFLFNTIEWGISQ